MATPSRDEIVKAVEQAIDGLFGEDPKTIDKDTPCNKWGVDSLDMIELLIEVENILNVEFAEEKLKPTNEMTFNQFVDQLVAAGTVA